MPNEIQARLVIKDLMKTPGFSNLDQSAKNRLIDRALQEKFGSVPNANVMLHENARSVKDDIPQIMFQAAQGPLGNLPQNIAENPLTSAFSGPVGTQIKSGAQAITGIKSFLFGGEKIQPETTEFSDKYLEPKTVEGKILGTIANIATGLAVPATAFIPKAIESVNPITTMMRQAQLPDKAARSSQMLKMMQAEEIAPLEQKMKRAESVFDLIKGRSESALEKPNIPKMKSSDLDEMLFTSGEEVGKKISEKSSEFTTKFGEGLENLKSSMTKQDLVDVVNNTINSLGADTASIPGTSANKLLNYLNKLAPEGDDLSQVLKPEDTQTAIRAIRNFIGNDTNAAIKFGRSVMETLPEKVPGLPQLRAEYAPKFDIVEGAKKYLKSSNLSKVAKGSAGSSRIAKMEEYAKKIGSEALERAKNFNASREEEVSLAQKAIDEFNLSAEESSKIGKSALAKIQNYLDELGSKKKDLLSKFEAESEDLSNLMRGEREDLVLEKIAKYKRLATLTAIASILGIQGIRKIFKEKF